MERHPWQKVCPQGVTNGSVSNSLQMGHSKSFPSNNSETSKISSTGILSGNPVSMASAQDAHLCGHQEAETSADVFKLPKLRVFPIPRKNHKKNVLADNAVAPKS